MFYVVKGVKVIYAGLWVDKLVSTSLSKLCKTYQGSLSYSAM